MMIRRILRLTTLLLVSGTGLVLLGCGPGDGRPVLARVSGTVTYKNAPLAGATVVFYPEQDGIRSANGMTDKQGVYTLWTYEPGDGAPVGNHKVAITLRGTPEKAALNPAMRNKDLGEAYYDQATATGKPLIPEKYFSTMTSGLTAVVEKGRQNTIDFTVEGAPPAKR